MRKVAFPPVKSGSVYVYVCETHANARYFADEGFTICFTQPPQSVSDKALHTDAEVLISIKINRGMFQK